MSNVKPTSLTSTKIMTLIFTAIVFVSNNYTVAQNKIIILGIGYYFMRHQQNETMVRTSVFITLLFCNISLTLINRSFRYSIFKTLQYKNFLIPMIIAITFLFIFILSLLYVPFMRQLFHLSVLSFSYIAFCIIIALVSTFWIEIFKVIQNRFTNIG